LQETDMIYLVKPTGSDDYETFRTSAEAGAYLRREGFESFEGATDEDLFDVAWRGSSIYSNPYWFASPFKDQAALDAWLAPMADNATIDDWEMAAQFNDSGWYKVRSTSTGREGWAHFAEKNGRPVRDSEVRGDLADLFPILSGFRR
jgi:hypothetical protein